MKYFLEYTDLSLAYEFISKNENIPLLDLFYSNKPQTIYTQNIVDVQQHTTESLFDWSEKTPEIYIYNIEKPGVDAASFETSDNYYFSFQGAAMSVGDKKKFEKTYDGSYVVCKSVHTGTVQEIIADYCNKYSCEILPETKKYIRSLSSYFEVLSLLDVVTNLDNEKAYVSLLDTEEKKPLYMLTFNPGQKNSISTWLDTMKDDEVQLVLALLHTKSFKLTRGGENVRKWVLKIDESIKKNSKISPKALLKYGMWSMHHEVHI